MADWSDDGWGSRGSSGGLSMWRSEWGNMRALQDQLDVQAAQAASEQRRLSSQLSRLQGDLTQRVDRLARAFDAFVELSQLRDELVLHADARRWRLAARRLVEARIAHVIVPAGGGTVPAVDVPGYWLAPAVRALPDVIEGGPHDADLDEAAARDELRTATFVVTAAPLLGAPAIVGRWLATALPADGSSTLTRGERAIWRAAADGLLAAEHASTVAAALAGRLGSTPSATIADLLVRRVPTTTAGIVPATPPDATVAAQAAAASAIDRWATWVEQVGARAASPAELPPSTTPPASDADLATDDLLLRVVRSLVEEGSTEERPLLDRAEELGAVVDPSAAAPHQRWDDPAGELADLLADDAVDQAHPARARFALLLVRQPLSAAADRLVAEAATAPPGVDDVRIGGRTIRVSGDGADAAAITAATAYEPTPRRLRPAHLAVAGAVVVLSVVLAIVAGLGWLVLAVVAGIVVGALWLADRAALGRDAASARADEDSAREVVARRAAALGAAQAAAASFAQRATAARERLATNLDALAAGRVGEEQRRMSAWPSARARHGGIDEIPVPGLPGRLWLCGKHAVGPGHEAALAEVGATTIVCLTQASELDERYPDYLAWLRSAPDHAIWQPIHDLHAPPVDVATELVGAIVARLAAGERIILHCAAGIGRSGTIAVCVLVELGATLDDALAVVAASRPMAGPEVGAQRELVVEFASLKPVAPQTDRSPT